jgi:hypothetical protein
MGMVRTSALALLLAAALAPTAHAVTDGAYRGTIDDDTAPVTVKVANGKLKKFKASIYASCGLDNFLITVAYPPAHQRGRTAPIRNNRFKVVFTGDPTVEDDKRTVTGRFTGAKVKGSIKVEGLCSADGTYTARR